MAPNTPTNPHELTHQELTKLTPAITEFHTYDIPNKGKTSSLLSQRINAPCNVVWSILRRFDKPQTYKHFIKSCSFIANDITVGCTRDVKVISGLPAATSTERLDILDDDLHVTGFSIIGGEHRLKNYRSVTTVHEFNGGDDDVGNMIWSVVLESYVVDVPHGNTEEDTRLFADTVVRLNLQKLASVSEGLAARNSNNITDHGNNNNVQR